MKGELLHNNYLGSTFCDGIIMKLEGKTPANQIGLNNRSIPRQVKLSKFSNTTITIQTFLQMKSIEVAKQLIVFDQKELKNVAFNEFYTTNNFKTLQLYINKVKIIESFAVTEINKNPTKEIFSFFIKVAKHCIDLGDYNIAFFLFTSLTTYSIRNLKGWKDMNRKTQTKWMDLQTIFMLSFNHKNLSRFLIFYFSGPKPS